MKFLGIDPGKSGGIAFIDQHSTLFCWKMPNTEREIADLIAELCLEKPIALIEKVHSMPQQGVKSTFTFGQNYGFLRGLLIAYKLPFDEISPQKWQTYLSCLSRGDKNVTKAKAQQLYPYLKIIHATADAVLIATYAMKVHCYP